MTATISFEIELAVTGRIIPYIPESGPTFSSGGEPAEGGYAEDIEIEDLGALELVPAPEAERGSHPRGVWKTISLLDGIDTNAPEIQKLFANILALKEQEASDAIMDDQ